MMLVIGFQTMEVVPLPWPSDIKTLPLGRSARCTDTIGRGTVPDQTPNWDGFPELEFWKLTETGVEVAALFAKSKAVAVRLCSPIANFVVSSEKVYGLYHFFRIARLAERNPDGH